MDDDDDKDLLLLYERVLRCYVALQTLMDQETVSMLTRAQWLVRYRRVLRRMEMVLDVIEQRIFF